METMQGLVAYPNGDIQLETVSVPKIGENPYAPHDVLCEVEYCGICGSDIHRWKSDKTGVKTSPHKVVVGHEIVSVVKAVGREVTTVKPGDRVVHEIVTFYCGRCPACLEGRFNICNTIPPMEMCIRDSPGTDHDRGWQQADGYSPARPRSYDAQTHLGTLDKGNGRG